MIEILDSLYKKLTKSKMITNFYEYYDYIKINTTFSINYCDEYLVLYAKLVDDKILISDLGGILEDSILNGISVEKIINEVKNNGLSFDGNSVFLISEVEDIEKVIKKFFNIMKSLDL